MRYCTDVFAAQAYSATSIHSYNNQRPEWTPLPLLDFKNQFSKIFRKYHGIPEDHWDNGAIDRIMEGKDFNEGQGSLFALALMVHLKAPPIRAMDAANTFTLQIQHEDQLRLHRVVEMLPAQYQNVPITDRAIGNHRDTAEAQSGDDLVRIFNDMATFNRV